MSRFPLRNRSVSLGERRGVSPPVWEITGGLTPRRSPERWILAGLLLVLLVGFSVKYAHKVLTIRPGQIQPHRSAVERWLPQLRAMEAGVDISQKYQYPHPPMMALVLMPLSHLQPLVAGLVWFWLKVALTGLLLHWLFRWSAEQGKPYPLWASVLTILLSLRPILGDLEHGNVNLFILFLVVAALTLYQQRRDVLAGVVLGLAVACKVTPGLFLPYLFWKRSWRALAGSVLGLGLFLWPGFVPAGLMGFGPFNHQLHSWYLEMVQPFVVQGKVSSELANQSLPGVVARLLTHSPADSRWDAALNQFVPTRYANFLDLDPALARFLVKGCMGLFALLVIWCCRTPSTTREGWRPTAEFALVVLGMLLFSERTWKHHCVTFVLPFAVLCYYLARCGPVRGLAAYLISTLAVAALLIAVTSDGLVPKRLADEAQIYGAYVGVYFVLIAALVVLLRQPAPEIEAPMG